MYEQEADRVAEAVMKNTERPSLSDHSAVPHIQRMCSQCEEEQDESLDDEDIKAASPDENQSLETPQETETQDTETQNAEAQDAQTNVDNQSPAEPVTDETTPITNGTTQIGDERTPEESPTETTTASLIAEDSTGELQAGQMRRAAFLSQLRTAVTATAEDALAGTGRTARDCPYIQYWFGYYSNQDATYIDRAMKRYAPETSGATTAEEAISMLAARVRRAVGVWATSGEITGVPEGVPTNLPAANPSEGAGAAASRTGSVLFKARDGGAKSADDPQAIQTRLGSGSALDGSVRSRMESAFGYDFSHVRVHTDAEAGELSGNLNARAFTVGEHVAFASGEYRPGSLIGDALIAHELAHVVQQRGADSSVEPLKKGEGEQGHLEEDADNSAVAAVVSMWGRTKEGLADISQNAMPRLKSRLRLSRCNNSSTPGTGTTTTACVPTFRSLQAVQTGSVNMTTAWPPRNICEMAFGLPTAAGMTFNSSVDVPSGCTGVLAYLQLIDRCLEKRDPSGAYQRRNSSGYVLDGQDPYDSRLVTAPGTVNYSNNDSPGSDAPGWDFMSINDKFKMWLLWTPDNPTGAPRVPLAMVEWRWAAKATKTGSSGVCASDWTLSDVSSSGGTGAATSTMPTWTRVYPRDVPYAPGRC
ncbi:MAG TPA: DUF4157 domain-containing protein [Pyrinomonadaceae bacterium]|jgi:hypothetical protein